MTTLRLLTTILFATASTAAYAASVTKTYTFADADGTPYCDGIQLTQTDKFDTGEVFGITCQEMDYGIGFKGKLPGAPAATWNLIYTDPTEPYDQYLAALDEGSRQWVLYFESQTYDIPFEEVNSGRLLKGRQGARPGAPSVMPQMRAKALLVPHHR
jgi:hypothetical protein